MKTPLNQAQTSVYYACKTTVDDELNYQIPELFALPKTIDLDRLQRAIIDTLRAHPYMCSLIEENEEGVPVVVEGKEPLVERFDITEDEWLEVQKTFARTMDIHAQRLYRAEIYQVVNGKCPNGKYLYLDIHHVLSDGFSLMALSRDISAAYNGQPLTPETLDGAAVAQEEAAQRADEKRMAEARDWYAKNFSDAAETDSLPIPQPELDKASQAKSIYRYYPLTITKKEVQTIRQRLDAKESTVMQTAWALLLAAYSAEE